MCIYTILKPSSLRWIPPKEKEDSQARKSFNREVTPEEIPRAGRMSLKDADIRPATTVVTGAETC